MPFLYPSHPGLVAPLWRRWPQRFDLPALCVGATMPDLVDGAIGLYRGHLGQSIGHSLLGLPTLCLFGGLAGWWALRAVARRLPRAERSGWAARLWNAQRDAVTEAPLAPVARVSGSLLVGAASHVAADLVSHDGGPLFWPAPRWHPYPDWWSHVWLRLPVPGYPDGYPLAPHLLAWSAVSLLGAWLLIRPLLRRT